MKIILSRKGFDSSYGGCPSPIFPDGSLLSLPIPSPSALVTFNEVQFNGTKVGVFVEGLTKRRTPANATAHLDPDLAKPSLPRDDGWLPAFGQTGAAQSHLTSQGVGVGDLFLFFGWFKRVEKTKDGQWRFVRGAPDLHVLFGWLQIGIILHVGAEIDEYRTRFPWLSRHPHLQGNWSDNNTIYVARNDLNLPGSPQLCHIPGGGIFESVAAQRILTLPDQRSRSLWRLPTSFMPSNDGRTLSYHADPKRWSKATDGWAHLQSVAKGQEFVLGSGNSSQDAEARAWVASLF